nr:hypothetical protein [Prosthecobacter debontii]
MQKVVARIVGETETFHEAAGTVIEDSGEGDELIQATLMECIMNGLLSRSIGDATAPVSTMKAPADLDTRSEVSGKLGLGQSGESSELPLHLDGPQSPPALSDAVTKTLESGPRFFLRQKTRKVLHDFWISVHGCKGDEVLLAP